MPTGDARGHADCRPRLTSIVGYLEMLADGDGGDLTTPHELAGVLSILVGLPLGLVDAEFAWRFALVAIGYGIVLSLAAVAVEEFSFRSYRRWGDLVRVLVAAVAENLGYRQLHAWWRLRGMVQALRGGAHDWGRMERTGFGPPAAVDRERATAGTRS